MMKQTYNSSTWEVASEDQEFKVILIRFYLKNCKCARHIVVHASGRSEFEGCLVYKDSQSYYTEKPYLEKRQNNKHEITWVALDSVSEPAQI